MSLINKSLFLFLLSPYVSKRRATRTIKLRYDAAKREHFLVFEARDGSGTKANGWADPTSPEWEGTQVATLSGWSLAHRAPTFQKCANDIQRRRSACRWSRQSDNTSTRYPLRRANYTDQRRRMPIDHAAAIYQYRYILVTLQLGMVECPYE